MNERRVPGSGGAEPTRRKAGTRFDLTGVVAAGDTHVGRVRSVNQDDLGEWRDADRPAQLLFVADGMGGHRGGEVASRVAVEQVGLAFGADDPDPERLLGDAFERANREVFQMAKRDFELAGMGTTGVALLLTGEPTAWVAHVGDSRAYRLRDGELEALTSDHSVVGELVRRGQLTPEQARVHPQSNEILRAIGTQPEVNVDIAAVDVRPGDRFLLCSDGLCGMLPDDEIARALGEAPPLEAVGRLIDLANEAGGTDNITVQIAEIPREAAAIGPPDGEETRAPSPGHEPAAAGTAIRWVVALALVGALLLLLLGGSGTSR